MRQISFSIQGAQSHQRVSILEMPDRGDMSSSLHNLQKEDPPQITVISAVLKTIKRRLGKSRSLRVLCNVNGK